MRTVLVCDVPFVDVTTTVTFGEFPGTFVVVEWWHGGADVPAGGVVAPGVPGLVPCELDPEPVPDEPPMRSFASRFTPFRVRDEMPAIDLTWTLASTAVPSTLVKPSGGSMSVTPSAFSCTRASAATPLSGIAESGIEITNCWPVEKSLALTTIAGLDFRFTVAENAPFTDRPTSDELTVTWTPAVEPERSALTTPVTEATPFCTETGPSETRGATGFAPADPPPPDPEPPPAGGIRDGQLGHGGSPADADCEAPTATAAASVSTAASKEETRTPRPKR
jgi:hypothetical protein